MTTWGYELETYKATLHLWEVICQSAVWPISIVFVIFGVKKIFGNHICELLAELTAKFNNLKTLSIKDCFTLAWNDPVNNNTKAWTDPKSIVEIVLMNCKLVEEQVTSLRQVIVSEKERGNFTDTKFSLENNDVFISSFFTPENSGDRYRECYKKLQEWKLTAQQSPHLIDDKEAFRVSSVAALLIRGLSARESFLYALILKYERTK